MGRCYEYIEPGGACRNYFHYQSSNSARLLLQPNRIVPPDQTIGGAEAGAATFILGLLNNELAGEQATYIAGLDGIERDAQAAHHKSFKSLSPEHQNELLTEIEQDRSITAWLVSPRVFFVLLMENVLEGFYADATNGGNYEAASWKMMGYRAEGGTW